MTRPEITGRRAHSAARPELNDIEDPYLNAPQVRQRYGGASNMWLHRRLGDDSGFPQPDLVVGDRRYWHISTLVRWERQQAAAAARPTSQRLATRSARR
jgi:hypothetical protein